jgi:hypothetical protein
VAIDEGPQRRFWIQADSEAGPDRVGCSYFDEWRDGDWQAGWDTWEKWFCEIFATHRIMLRMILSGVGSPTE